MSNQRVFRTTQSFAAEKITRDMLPAFLESRGFSTVKDERRVFGGGTESQKIVATTAAGKQIVMRVRLCWRQGRATGTEGYTAAQLLSTVKNGNWEGSISKKVERELKQGITHFLLVERKETTIRYAALLPLAELLNIWRAQRDTSQELIDQGQLHRKRPHGMNGSSPTIYLNDDTAPTVAAALWNYPGVQDLVHMVPNDAVWLSAKEALTVESKAGDYRPEEGDRRSQVERQILERRGQQSFRNKLCKRFGNKCAVTGSTVLDVLEAAHIKPYRRIEDNNPQNGLLLRSDIHTLFDLDLLGIEPESLVLELNPAILKEYGYLAGVTIKCDLGKPSETALRIRYAQFQERLRR